MRVDNPLGAVVQEIISVAEQASLDRKVSPADLRRLLSFLSKVSLVLDQAFHDVIAILVDIQLLEEHDLETQRLPQLRRDVEMITERSRYKEAEEICSRLAHLREFYENEIRATVAHLPGNKNWNELFWLVEEREGRVINLVHEATRELGELLQNARPENLWSIKQRARDTTEAVRAHLRQLRTLTGKVMGLSGRDGFLEMTLDREALAREMLVLVNGGSIHMSRDTYSGNQVGAMGPNAHAHDISFQQMNTGLSGIDLRELAKTLSELRGHMKAQGTTLEHDTAVGHIAAAEAAASKGDSSSVVTHLKSAGTWALDVASKTMSGVAVLALKQSLGL